MNSYKAHRIRQMVAADPAFSDEEKGRYFAFLIYLQWAGVYEREHRHAAPSFERYRALTGASCCVTAYEQTGLRAFSWKASQVK